MKKNRLVYKVYKKRREEFIKGEKKDKKNWCYWTFTILKELSLEHIWESEKLPLGKNFNKLVNKLVKRKEEDEWLANVAKKSKLRVYRKLKSRLVLEDYVIELDREKRRQLTMLRGGTNKLRIETGRWRGESEEERVCNVCLCQEVENETHFILACPMYVVERANMFCRIREEISELEYVENMEEEWQLNLLIGIGWGKKNKEIREIVLDYLKKVYEIRRRYIK